MHESVQIIMRAVSRRISLNRLAAISGLLSVFFLAFSVATSAQVVILAHPDSGAYVVVSNEQGSKLKAMKRANSKRQGGGWTPLLASTVPGYGAMFCFRPKGNDVRYFFAEGKDSPEEAVTDAKSQAIAAARGTGETVYWCGTWNNRNVHPLDNETKDDKAGDGPRSVAIGVRG